MEEIKIITECHGLSTKDKTINTANMKSYGSNHAGTFSGHQNGARAKLLIG